VYVVRLQSCPGSFRIVPVSDLFHLVDFKRVCWDLIFDILPTWSGMVRTSIGFASPDIHNHSRCVHIQIFVMSFASCLDVATISLDMGEALDTNRELSTVGICNCKSQREMVPFLIFLSLQYD
jgi:hypothetical protein